MINLKFLTIRLNQIQFQYNLVRETATISALSSKELDKYEYLIGEYLRYKPGVAERAKFENSPLGKVFNKGLKEADEK